MSNNQKHICWFSCGAPSAVMSAIVSKQIPECEIVYCRVEDEHEDNLRFLADVEKWINKKIIILKSDKYKNVDDVIEKRNYISGHKGAPCTMFLKRQVRIDYAGINDVHYWGLALDEGKRIENWNLRNPKLINNYPLQKYYITTEMCLAIIERAGIELPVMYKLGFEHNNCIGCVKSQSPKYWNMTRKHFPEVFKKRCEQSRKLNYRMVKVKGVPIFLDELQETEIEHNDIDISCDIGCESVYKTFNL